MINTKVNDNYQFESLFGGGEKRKKSVIPKCYINIIFICNHNFTLSSILETNLLVLRDEI